MLMEQKLLINKQELCMFCSQFCFLFRIMFLIPLLFNYIITIFHHKRKENQIFIAKLKKLLPMKNNMPVLAKFEQNWGKYLFKASNIKFIGRPGFLLWTITTLSILNGLVQSSIRTTIIIFRENFEICITEKGTVQTMIW
jgi:hypothetical protein